MKAKRPVIINCLDLDETLMKTEKLYERFGKEMADEIKNGVDLLQLFEYWLKNKFPKQDDNPEDLVSNYIIDSPNGKLAKAIKHALSLGDKFAIVTFNMSKNYTKFALALMGLTKEEIDQIYIRHRDSDNVPDNKNAYIMEAVEHFGFLENVKAAKNNEINQDDEKYPFISLLDDNFDNCQAARSEGMYGFCVQEAKLDHVREYCYYMHADTKEYLNVVLPTVAERFVLAKTLIEDTRQLTISVKAGVQVAAVDLHSLLQVTSASPSADTAGSKRKREESELAAQSSAQSSLYSNEVLGQNLETATVAIPKQIRKSPRLLAAKDKELKQDSGIYAN